MKEGKGETWKQKRERERIGDERRTSRNRGRGKKGRNIQHGDENERELTWARKQEMNKQFV